PKRTKNPPATTPPGIAVAPIQLFRLKKERKKKTDIFFFLISNIYQRLEYRGFFLFCSFFFITSTKNIFLFFSFFLMFFYHPGKNKKISFSPPYPGVV
ncbi:hypothetical protein F7D07_25180, partial [Escherichia coli]|nr:hypothetical protein [Escherichia coli]